MVLQTNEHTAWVAEYLIKDKKDIDLIGQYVTAPKGDVEAVNREAAEYGEQGLIRGHICCFEAAGANGGFILCASDHFFDADPNLIKAHADETRHCVY